MALLPGDDSQITALAESIVATIEDPTDEQTAARNIAVAATKDMVQKIMQYLIDYMEIDGVEIALDAGPRTVETYAAGVGNNGGSLVAAPYPVAGSVVDGKADTGSQSNGGSGLIS